MEKKVNVKSLSNGRVIINIPELNFKRVWERKGVTMPIDGEILQQIIYNLGVETLFKEGYLYIDDKATRVELGLEGEDENDTIIIFTEPQLQRYLTIAPMDEFEAIVKKAPLEQVNAMVSYAINHELIDLKRDDILQKRTGKDIVKIIQMKRANEEPVEGDK